MGRHRGTWRAIELPQKGNSHIGTGSPGRRTTLGGNRRSVFRRAIITGFVMGLIEGLSR